MENIRGLHYGYGGVGAPQSCKLIGIKMKIKSIKRKKVIN